MVHDVKHASFVLGKIRGSQVAIYKPVFEMCLTLATTDLQKSQTEIGIPPEIGLSEEFDYLF